MTNLSRRTLLGALGLIPAAGLLAACDSDPAPTTTGSLVFDKTKYTSKTTTVTTAAGEVEVEYRLFSKIPYVAKPVDVDYQSLTIAVPVTIAGKAVDASDAPILFEIPVGGYMSAKATDDPFAAGGGMPGGGMPGGLPSGMAGLPSGGPGGMGGLPSGMAGLPSGGPGGMGGLPTGAGSSGQNASAALAAGWVVVQVAARGRDNKTGDGKNFGTAPAVIVDLKAAIRYLKANKGTVPGNTDKIVSDGTSAGGAVSTLLGASGGSDLYTPYLTALGAADADDTIFAVAAYCPITDLENADGAYEFLWGSLTSQATGKTVDQGIAKELSDAFTAYQKSLHLTGVDGKDLTADRYQDYLLTTYLQPAATKYLSELSAADRAKYLSANAGIAWSGGKAVFTFADYLKHLGTRKKAQPAFDAFDLSAGENNEFGSATTDTRHFTEFSLKNDTSGKSGTALDSDIPQLLTLMNPMYFLTEKNAGRAKNWFFRVGTSDTDTSLTVLSNLVAGVTGLGDTVDALMYWDAGHAVNQDADKFIAWAGKVTGYTAG
ncbi:hypothetical protein GCM10010435_26810 [Winogradskya consettensis]|uniref:BD-FAE-like domain-containing protein n=1 Tax=Winogradskya consettensis TaxID=113560 RepID=A0A919SBX9_9ACTN|nr:subtype B tannase [Actinoplanes consettensis]GIM68176.1 hypothetical protein Aco04nite_09600 [Actinoplanes consettensis]